jgi:hypothetical protein
MTTRQHINKTWRIFSVAIYAGLIVFAVGIAVHPAIWLVGLLLAMVGACGISLVGKCGSCAKNIGYMFQRVGGFQGFQVSPAPKCWPYCGAGIDTEGDHTPLKSA